jgi:hypothetical protein
MTSRKKEYMYNVYCITIFLQSSILEKQLIREVVKKLPSVVGET